MAFLLGKSSLDLSVNQTPLLYSCPHMGTHLSLPFKVHLALCTPDWLQNLPRLRVTPEPFSYLFSLELRERRTSCWDLIQETNCVKRQSNWSFIYDVFSFFNCPINFSLSEVAFFVRKTSFNVSETRHNRYVTRNTFLPVSSMLRVCWIFLWFDQRTIVFGRISRWGFRNGESCFGERIFLLHSHF